jgi:glycosyltransferase involved in cell wall biosynthesis
MIPKPGRAVGRTGVTVRQVVDPIVSVIVPVRNGATTVETQLDALARQTFSQPWELLVAVQPSDDGTEAIVERFAAAHHSVHPEVHVVDARARLGAGYARNEASAAAQAPLLGFCDGDDVVDERWLEELVAADGEVRVGLVVPFTSPFDPVSLDRSRAYLPGVECDFLPTAYTCNMVVDRARFEAAGGFDLHFDRNHDVDLSWRLQLAGATITQVDRAVVYKRDRATLWTQWLQLYRWCRYEPLLYKRYRTAGMPGSPPYASARDFAWLVVTAPVAWHRRFRGRWIDRSARRLGRLVGSVLERTAYL